MFFILRNDRKGHNDLIRDSRIPAIPKETSTIPKPIKRKTSGSAPTNSPRMRAKKGMAITKPT